MSRQELLELCLAAMLALPKDELSRLLPQLAALAEPYLNEDDHEPQLHDCVSLCLRKYFA